MIALHLLNQIEKILLKCRLGQVDKNVFGTDCKPNIKHGQHKAWCIPLPKNLTRWRWPLTLKINRAPDSLNNKYVTSLVKIHGWMLILECSQGCYGRTDGSVTISLHNFVGEGLISLNVKIFVNLTFINQTPF